MENIKKIAKQSHIRDLSIDEKKIMTLLGLPTFGLALSVTVVVTYVPLIARQFIHSTAIIGLIIATEGIVALFLPILAGSYSDHLRTRIGGRLPFIIVGTPLSALSLLFLGFINTLWLLILCTVIFFVAYYISYEPYRALYPDMVSDDASGRAQSVQAIWRGAGTGIALAIGSFLFAVKKWLTFTLSSLLSFGAVAVFVFVLLKRHGVPKQHQREPDSFRQAYLAILRLLRRDKKLRDFIIANTLWELSLAALKSFILLYLIVGLGHSKVVAATIVTTAAFVILLAAPLSGKLADRVGKTRVMRIAAVTFGLSLLGPFFTTDPWFYLLIMPLGAFGGSVVLSLPYALLIPMMPRGEHGRITGLYSTSRGVGIMLGPLIAGAAIALGSNTLPYNGYGAMWLVCAGAMLLSLPFIAHTAED